MNKLTIKTATALVKERFKSHRNFYQDEGITFNTWVEYVVKKLPQFDCLKGYEHLRNVWFGRVADLEVTELSFDWITSIKFYENAATL